MQNNIENIMNLIKSVPKDIKLDNNQKEQIIENLTSSMSETEKEKFYNMMKMLNI